MFTVTIFFLFLLLKTIPKNKVQHFKLHKSTEFCILLVFSMGVISHEIKVKNKMICELYALVCSQVRAEPQKTLRAR